MQTRCCLSHRKRVVEKGNSLVCQDLADHLRLIAQHDADILDTAGMKQVNRVLDQALSAADIHRTFWFPDR